MKVYLTNPYHELSLYGPALLDESESHTWLETWMNDFEYKSSAFTILLFYSRDPKFRKQICLIRKRTEIWVKNLNITG